MQPQCRDRRDWIGSADTARRSIIVRAEKSFPSIISRGFIVVVSISSSVCFSRSPLTLLAVRAGIINIRIMNSMEETKV